MTEWILKKACRQIAEWKGLSPGYANIKMSVNLSGKHLADENLICHIQNALEEANLDPQHLILELTESTATENAFQTVKMFQKLRDLNIRLSIDDFGTGYSSLSYLHKLPFNSLKIDRSFISDFQDGNENAQILQTIVTLAKNLDLKIS
jgi:EAL domain-containing protein (putative c-di-GMP-specific phosphodiesterase class I)